MPGDYFDQLIIEDGYSHICRIFEHKKEWNTNEVRENFFS
jgi:hypothetical protein